MNNEQSTDISALIAKLRNEYEDLKGKCCRLHAFLCDIDFEKTVPDRDEQNLMREQGVAMLRYLNNLRDRISCKERQLTTDKWLKMQQPKAIVDTPCGPVRVVNIDEDNQHHCGQDATSPVDSDPASVEDKNYINGQSLQELIGHQVINVTKEKCESCPLKHYGAPCKKVELVGGSYLCLAPLPNSIVTE